MVLVGKVTNKTDDDFVLVGSDNSELICQADESDLAVLKEGAVVTLAGSLTGAAIVVNGAYVRIIKVEEVI